MHHTRRTHTTLVAFLIWSLTAAMPPITPAAEPTLGLTTGVNEAQMAVNGTQWATLSISSAPTYEHTLIRTGKGTASMRLKDGSQLELQPHTLISLSGTRTAPVVNIALGQVLFRTHTASRVAFVTPTVRYETLRATAPDRAPILTAAALAGTADPIGTLTVSRQGGSRLGLQQGEMLATATDDATSHVVTAGHSVYIPHTGPADPAFGVLLAQALPDETIGSMPPTADTENAPNDDGLIGGIGTGTVVGLGVAAAGVGAAVAIGMNHHKASPSAP